MYDIIDDLYSRVIEKRGFALEHELDYHSQNQTISRLKEEIEALLGDQAARLRQLSDLENACDYRWGETEFPAWDGNRLPAVVRIDLRRHSRGRARLSA